MRTNYHFELKSEFISQEQPLVDYIDFVCSSCGLKLNFSSFFSVYDRADKYIGQYCEACIGNERKLMKRKVFKIFQTPKGVWDNREDTWKPIGNGS